jgi:hypothetical protein
MGTSTFNFVPQKRSASTGRKFLPVVATEVEVFVCVPHHRKLRITREGCARASRRAVDTPGSMSPCADCFVGDSHRRDRRPGTWPDGSPIETQTIVVIGGGPGPTLPRHPAD